MKNIFKYLNIAVLFIALATVFVACKDSDEVGAGNQGMSIKVFFPTVVAPGQPMTINGTGLGDVTEIVFPGDLKVTGDDIDKVSNEMIRVKAPMDIKEGGTIIVRNSAGETAESRLPLSVGRTQIEKYSVQENDTVNGNTLISIYGKDMQFISYAEFINEDEEIVYVEAKDFYRVANDRVTIRVPSKVATGYFPIVLYTQDAQVLKTVDFYFVTEQNGHWERVRKYLWQNDDPDGNGPVNWNGTYRFSNVEHITGEQIYAFEMEDWALIKDGQIHLLIDGNKDSNVRVTTGWWSAAYGGGEFNCIALAEEDEVTGKLSIPLNIKVDENIYGAIDDQHLLFTGSGYTPLAVYIEEMVWVEDAAEETIVIWSNEDGEPIPAWGGKFRFGKDGKDGGGECIATFDEETWDQIKNGEIYVLYTPNGNANVRVTTGWWSAAYGGGEHNCNEDAEDAEGGDRLLKLNIKADENIYGLIDDQHLLFTGSDYTLKKIYYIKTKE